MSVYIKGMEMPTDCGHCRFAVDGWCYAYGKPNINALANDGRTNFCPLVPVPPHGDLIDKRGVEVLSWTEDPEKDFADGVLFVLDKLDELPIIILADEQFGISEQLDKEDGE